MRQNEEEKKTEGVNMSHIMYDSKWECARECERERMVERKQKMTHPWFVLKKNSTDYVC